MSPLTQFSPFWVVWCMGGGAPTRRHTSLGSAQAEAARLAAAHPGDAFVVLQSVELSIHPTTALRVSLSPPEDFAF